ncbi:AMP-binding protein [Marinicella sp. W31]|uniref:AMP-binding protein n=1 Tax=Marinicella sp. W31 TaxID=3023713 RepID=UPI0037578634
MLNVKDTILSIIKAHPQAHALWVNDCYYTYQEIYCQAQVLASHIQNCKSEFCIIIAEKTVNRYIAILGCVLAGKTFVPVTPEGTNRQVNSIFSQLDSDCYVIDINNEDNKKRITSLMATESRVFDLSEPLNASDTVFDNTRDAVHAYVMFTSGSTGVPKGVPVSGENLASYISNTVDLFKPTHRDKFAQINSYTFDLSMHDIFTAWSVGACIYAFPTNSPFKYVRFVQQHDITFWLSVPSTGVSLNEIGLLKKGAMPSLKCTLFCGEALPFRLVEQWQLSAPNSQVYNVYGPTECTIAITYFECERDLELPKIVPIGQPYADQQMMLVDNTLREVTEGKGELVISGSQVTSGYYQNIEKTAHQYVSIEGYKGVWYRTGDLVEWSQDYGYIYQGRIDDQLKIRGYRVERLEIETLLREATGTDSVAVVGWPITETGLSKGLVAFIDKSPLELPEIRANYKRLMPEYMWPSQIYQQPLPQNNSLKVDYKALKQQLQKE